MRDLLLFSAMLVIVPLGLRNAFAAYLLWGWAGLIALQTFTYGFMRSVPYVMVFAVLALTTLLLDKDPERRPVKTVGIAVLLVMFGVQALFSATFAYPNLARNWELCTDLLKTLLFALLMPMVVTNRLRVHAFVVMLCISAGFQGLLEGLKFLATGGAHLSQGNLKLGDRNNFAVLVTMCLPLLLYLYWYSREKWMKVAAMLALVVNVMAVISTHSRAGLICLIVVGLILMFTSRRRVLSFVMVSTLAVMAVAFAPDNWTARMTTISSANEDSSFMGRVTAWKRSTAIALEHPLLGGGIRAVQDTAVYRKYRYSSGLLGFVDTPDVDWGIAAHSIYFEVLGDMGFLGLFLFVSIMFSPFVFAMRTRSICRTLGPSAGWARDLQIVLSAGMAAFLVGGATLSAAYFELAYTIVMLSAVVFAIVRDEGSRTSKVGKLRTSTEG